MSQIESNHQFNHYPSFFNIPDTIVTATDQELQRKLALWEQNSPKLFAFDWDGTLTTNGFVEKLGRNQASIWQELKTQLNFPEWAVKLMDEHVKTYVNRTDQAGQMEWADKTYEVYRELKLTEVDFKKVALNLELRSKALATLKVLVELGHHVCIVSYGLKQPIEWILENFSQGLSKKVKVIADTLEFDEQGYIIGANPNYDRVLPVNKGNYITQFAVDNYREEYLRVGSLWVGDSKFDTDAMRDLPLSIGVYLHHKGNLDTIFEEYHNTALAHEHATVVVNKDSFEPIVDIIQALISLSSRTQ